MMWTARVNAICARGPRDGGRPRAAWKNMLTARDALLVVTRKPPGLLVLPPLLLGREERDDAEQRHEEEEDAENRRSTRRASRSSGRVSFARRRRVTRIPRRKSRWFWSAYAELKVDDRTIEHVVRPQVRSDGHPVARPGMAPGQGPPAQARHRCRASTETWCRRRPRTSRPTAGARRKSRSTPSRTRGTDPAEHDVARRLEAGVGPRPPVGHGWRSHSGRRGPSSTDASASLTWRNNGSPESRPSIKRDPAPRSRHCRRPRSSDRSRRGGSSRGGGGGRAASCGGTRGSGPPTSPASPRPPSPATGRARQRPPGDHS